MYDLIIIGAGPSGMACGIEARKAGLKYLIIEKGGIADAIRRFPIDMTFFSTPELLELGALPFTTTNIRPTRIEALEYYRRVADYFKLNIQTHSKVTDITSPGASFNVQTANPEATITAKQVILATGYFDFTNQLNIPGENLPHVHHYYTEPFAYSRTNVVVIGGRNSAVETALDLYRHGANVTLIHRGPELGSIKYWVRPDIENRIKAGSIACYLNSVVAEIKVGELLAHDHQNNKQFMVKADFIFALIGYRPDEKLLRRAGVELDDKTLIPRYDPKTFETNIPGLYIAGSVACGCETWNIFIENGRAHAQPIIDDIVRIRGVN